MPEDDIADRLTTVEETVAQLRAEVRNVAVARSDAAAARVLASGAHEDVAEVRSALTAHTRTLNALRETQVEQGQQITELRTELAALDSKVTDGFTKLNIGMAQITALLSRLTGDTDESAEP